jgi:hypothetical protein
LNYYNKTHYTQFSLLLALAIIFLLKLKLSLNKIQYIIKLKGVGMDSYKFISDDDAIDLNILDTHDKTLFEKEKQQREESVMKSLREDYVSFMRENYEADDNLFDMVEDLLEESEDQEKLLKVLDSL